MCATDAIEHFLLVTLKKVKRNRWSSQIYLIQPIQNIISTYTLGKIANEVFHTPFLRTKAVKSGVYFLLPVHPIFD